jgi:hypothetical protein
MTTPLSRPLVHSIGHDPIPPRKRPEPPKPRKVDTRQRGQMRPPMPPTEQAPITQAAALVL